MSVAAASPLAIGFDAIVIGAGPAGSSAAILLARAGWSVALVEKQRFPRRKVCGECIAASNWPLLDALGVGEAVRAEAGLALRQVALMAGPRSVLAPLPGDRDSRDPWGRALGRETLDTLLLARAREAGVTVWQPWSVESIEGSPGDHRCDVRALGEAEPESQSKSPAPAPAPAPAPTRLTLRAPVLIAAHGSWQPLPSARERRRGARRPGDLFAFKANFRGAALPEGVLPVLALDGGYGGMVVADHGLLTLACCIREDRLAALRAAAPGARAGEVVEAWLQQSCGGVAAALRGARREGAWLASGPLDPGVRVRADDALLRIGNAAGEAHPIIGEGMSMALQSAWLLCAELLAQPRPLDPAWHRAIRARHAATWRQAFAPRLALAAAFAHTAMRPAGSAALLAAGARWPALLTAGARWAGKTRCAVDPATIHALRAGAPLPRPAPVPAGLHAAAPDASRI